MKTVEMQDGKRKPANLYFFIVIRTAFMYNDKIPGKEKIRPAEEKYPPFGGERRTV